MSNHKKKKSYLSIFEEVSKQKNGHAYQKFDNEQADYPEEEGSSLTDELDHEVLMHRDAHFGGDFKVMFEYYEQEGIGTHPDIDLERIAYLAEIEKQLGENLAPLILTGSEAESVAKARRAYENLKEIYEIEEGESPFPRLLADLILSEEEEPAAEIEAVVSQGTRIVPELLHIVKSDDAFNPLFPGYGYAPYLAILCLGQIGDASAIVPLFETLGREMVFDEEPILEAFYAIGDPAKRFLLTLLPGRPITKDTINAAFALTVFANQIDVALVCLEQLKNPEVHEKPLLRSYLLMNCEGIKGTPYEMELAKMGDDCDLPHEFCKEIQSLLKTWHSRGGSFM